MQILLKVAAALLPALVLVYHIYRRDKYQPEPTGQLLKGAGWGIVSLLIAVIVGAPFHIFGFHLGGTETLIGSLYESFMGAAVPEECAKAFCLYMFLKKNPYFDEYMDGIVYAVAVGMGFAGLENVMYLAGASNWMTVGAMRALMAVPAHFGFAVLMGYFYSLWRINGNRNSLIQMFLAPILAHGIYDTLCFVMQLSGMAAVLVMAAMVVFMHYLRVSCSRLIARQLQRDFDSSGCYNRDERYIGGCSDGREDI